MAVGKSERREVNTRSQWETDQVYVLDMSLLQSQQQSSHKYTVNLKIFAVEI